MVKSKISKRAKQFQATRIQHRTETAEDYTELVAELISLKGAARTCDIARHLGISHVTAIRTLRRLARDGYLIAEARKPTILTDKGKKLARESRDRHELLLSFLLAIGVPQKIAEQDVEGVEHHISAVSLNAIKAHMQRMK